MEFLERLGHPVYLLLVAPRGFARLRTFATGRVHGIKLVDLVKRRSVADADEKNNEEYISGHSVFPVERRRG